MINRLRQLVRDIGAMNTMLYVASRVLSASTSGRARLVKYYITTQAIPPADLTPARRGQQILVTEADRDEALAIPAERPRNVIESRLASGGRCLVARKGEAIVGFQWFTLDDYPEDEVRCLFHLAPEDRCAWDYDIYVFPDWRTQPVFTRLWDTCNRILRGSQIRASLSRISAYNGASRRAHERMGAKAIGWATFLCLGRIQLALFSQSPYMHFSTHPGSAPVLAVSRIAARSMRSSSHNN